MNPDEQAHQEISELLNRYHPRASVHDDGKMIFEPSQVLDNITTAMERIDLDINTEISIEEDVATADEIMGMIQSLRLGPTLAVHVVNTALRIMSARYPAELVGRPFPPGYDLRKRLDLAISDQEHQIAVAIFNRRTTSTVDLAASDVAADLEPLELSGQMTIFVALFYMYGTKVGALNTAPAPHKPPPQPSARPGFWRHGARKACTGADHIASGHSGLPRPGRGTRPGERPLTGETHPRPKNFAQEVGGAVNSCLEPQL